MRPAAGIGVLAQGAALQPGRQLRCHPAPQIDFDERGDLAAGRLASALRQYNLGAV